MEKQSRQLLREFKDLRTRNRKFNGTTSDFKGIENYNIEIKYYIVEAKSGHVGKSNYLKVSLPVSAINKKEAIQKVRTMPRIKRDHKDFIYSISEVSLNEYNEQITINKGNMYFYCKSIQEQNIYCFDDLEICKEDSKKISTKWDKNYDRKDRIEYTLKKENLKRKTNYRYGMMDVC